MQYSIVSLKDLNDEFRIDSEYYTPDNLVYESIVKKHKYELLGNICKLIAGPFGSTVTTEKYDVSSDRRYIRGKDVQSFFIDDSDEVFIEKSLFEELSQFHLQERDILITVVGMKFGKVAIVFEEDYPSIFSCKSTLLRNASVNTFFLAAYLSSDIGYRLLRRGQRGAAQPGINLFDIQTVPVPILSIRFQEKIEELVVTARLCIQNSKALYTEAERILLSELGLQDWKPKHQLSFVRNYSEAQQAERFDAEYFQPMYREVEKHLISKCSATKIGDIDFIKVTTGQYTDTYTDEKTGAPYIRGTNLSLGTIDDTDIFYIDPELQIKSKKAKEGDVVVTRVGTIGAAARIPKKYEGGTISDNLIRLRFDQSKLNSFFLATYLSSILGQNLMIGNSRGSVQQRLNQETLKEIRIPLISMEKQEKIASLAKRSEELRDLSKTLLENAKKAVEIAIENDEDSAIKWLEIQKILV